MAVTSPDLTDGFGAALVARRRVGPTRPRDLVGALQRRWVWVVTLIAWVQYSLAGYWLISVRHFAIGDSLDRTLTAELMVFGRDPHLASIGLYWMPLPTVSRIPFVMVLHPLGQAQLAGPVTSALFAALTIPVLVEIARWSKASPVAGGLVVASWAISPVTLWTAANGMSESAFGLFLAIAMLGLLRLTSEPTSRNMAVLGLGLGGAMACRYETLVLIGAVAIGLALVLPRRLWSGASSIVMLPPLTVFALWCMFSKLIGGDALYWYHASRDLTATPDYAPWLPADINLASSTVFALKLSAVYAPVMAVVLVASCTGWRRAREGAAVLGAFWCLPALFVVQLASLQSWAEPRFLVHLPIIGAAAALWVISGAPRGRVAMSLGWLACALVPLGVTTASWWLADADHSYAEGEFVFIRSVLGEGASASKESLDANFGKGGRSFRNDLTSVRDIARDLDDELAAGAVVAADTGVAGAVPILYSAHPDQFLVPEDRRFEVIMSDPVGRVDFILRMQSRQGRGATGALEKELGRTADGGGTWELVRSYDDDFELYEFVPTSDS